MELKPSQYEAALRLIKSAGDAVDHLAACARRKDDVTRMRRSIEEVEALIKKIKRELKIG